jgi:hypothetical protein
MVKLTVTAANAAATTTISAAVTSMPIAQVGEGDGNGYQIVCTGS